MKYTITILFVGLIALVSCQSKPPNYNEIIEGIPQFDNLQARFDKDSEQVWVVNFWATTCGPCIKEMPHFQALENEYRDIKVLLVSLDRSRDLDDRVYPFVVKHNIKPEVVLLEDQDYSYWTEKIDPSWYGALPATLIFRGSDRNFKFGVYEGYQELVEDVNLVKK